MDYKFFSFLFFSIIYMKFKIFWDVLRIFAVMSNLVFVCILTIHRCIPFSLYNFCSTSWLLLCIGLVLYFQCFLCMLRIYCPHVSNNLSDFLEKIIPHLFVVTLYFIVSPLQSTEAQTSEKVRW